MNDLKRGDLRMPRIIFSLTGEVMCGNEKGKIADIPSAKLQINYAESLPAFGVYATIVHVDGNQYYGVTNVGWRQTMDWSRKETVETFILDYSSDLYGKTVTIDFYKYLRETIEFNSLDEVRHQVNKDCDAARSIFNNLLLCC